MNIRAKLTVQFAIVTASILVIFSFTIYYFSANYRENQFQFRLKEKALNTAKLLLEIEEIDAFLLQKIDRTSAVLPQEVIEIYDQENLRKYRSRDPANIIVDLYLLGEIRKHREMSFKQGEYECIGLTYSARGKEFVVISSAFDRYGINRLSHLRILLSISLFIASGVIFGIGYLSSGMVFRPILKVIHEVDQISFSNLSHRVDEGNGKDEIATLAITFNRMLDRIETAFQVQKSFVSNASHELRTPITALMTQIEVTLMKDRTIEEYQEVLQSLIEDLRSLNELISGLLYLAQADLDITQIKQKNIRIDELLWQSQHDLIRSKKDYSVHIEFSDLPNDEESLHIIGNENLLRTAFMNMMDNGCKYSNNHYCRVSIGFPGKFIEIEFLDQGIGIPKAEIERVTQPFFRGENASNIKGHGLGLSLTKKIVELHGGRITIHSQQHKGTRVCLFFPMAKLATAIG